MMVNKYFRFIIVLVLGLIAFTICQNSEGIPAEQTSTPQNSLQTTGGVPFGANQNCSDLTAFGFLEEDVPVKGANVQDPILFRWEYYLNTSGL